MDPELGLAPLLAALRESGLRVGFAELARLRHIFRQPHDASDGGRDAAERLRALLRAVIVKSRDDAAIFERVYETWLTQLAWEPSAPSMPPRRVDPSPPRQRRWGRWVVAVAVLVAVLGIGSVVGYRWLERPTVQDPVPVPPPPPPPPPPPIELPERLTPDEIRTKTFPTQVPKLDVFPGTPTWTGGWALACGALALFGAGGLWWQLRQKRTLPEPAPLPSARGTGRIFVEPPELRAARLLDDREQEALVWGIGRFVSEEPTPRLDLTATVAATARSGGVPTPRFELARFHREVWLWIDETTDDPLLHRLADELVATLEPYGLPVERASFRGVPERLVTPEGQVFAPREVDERRDGALVAILTDGRVLCRRRDADSQRTRIDAVLRSLSHWPQLAFVDFAPADGGLRAVLTGHQLAVLEPSELVGFLADGVETARSRARRGTVALPEDDRSWAAVCALAPSPVSEATALELRRRLHLAVSPWALSALQAEARGPGGLLAWTRSQRARRVNHLWHSEGEGEGVEDGTLFARALDAWQELYAEEEQRRLANEKKHAWRGTLAAQQLRIERLLLELFRPRSDTVAKLYEFFGGAHGKYIALQLSALAPHDRLADKGRDKLIELPWAWTRRTGTERVMLAEMELGGDLPKESLRRPGRLLLGVGLCLGLGLGGLLAAALAGERPPVGRPDVACQDCRVEERTDGRWEVLVKNRLNAASEVVEPGARVVASLSEDRGKPCVERVDGGDVEIWRCGSRGIPPVLVPWVGRAERSLAVLAASGRDVEVEALAIALLDSGSTDVVLTGERALPVLDRFLGETLELEADEQLLVLGSPSRRAPLARSGGRLLDATVSTRWSALSAALDFDGVRPVAEVWPQLGVVAGDTSRVLLRGLGACPVEWTDERGIIFVRICPGTFVMGSSRDEVPRPDDDELPAHQVTLTEAFWIGKYEVTLEQYRAWKPEHRQRFDDDPTLPVTDVSWHDANAFCRVPGYGLPTEAQWEYAARAGTDTPWSVGADEALLGDYAWFDEGFSGGPHPVGQKKANPWGLHDMHGNVWEWVNDWYRDRYPEEAQVDPLGPTEEDATEIRVIGTDEKLARVLRGGSFADEPRNLRSADRNWNRPSFRFRNDGFRCVLPPPREP